MPDSVFEKLRAYEDKIDSPDRLALFQGVGVEHYADAEYLNLLRSAIIQMYDVGPGNLDQNNIGRTLPYVYFQYEDISAGFTLQERLKDKLNISAFTITATQTPVMVPVIVVGDPTGAKLYRFFFKPGKGVWGLGGTAVKYNDLEQLSFENLQIGNVVEDPNTIIVPIGALLDHDYLATLNGMEHSFNAPGKVYVVIYTIGIKSYMLYFTGIPGIYGGSGVQFTDNQFSKLTDSDVVPQIMYTSQLINDGDGTSKYARESQLDAAYNNSVKLNPSNDEGQVISSGFLKILTSGIQALWGKITGNLEVGGWVSSDLEPQEGKHLTRMDWVLNKLTGKADHGFIDDNATPYLVMYNGKIGGLNLAIQPDNLLIPYLHAQNYNKWLEAQINSTSYKWVFTVGYEKVIELTAKSRVHAYNNIHVVSTLQKTEVSPDLFEVEIETKILE